MSRSGISSIALANALIASLLPQNSASSVSSNRVIHASTSVEPKMPAVLQRHSCGSSSGSITRSSPKEAKKQSLLDHDKNPSTVLYSSDLVDSKARDVQRELFSAPTVAPTTATVCQAGDEDFDADLGCSFGDSTDNNG